LLKNIGANEIIIIAVILIILFGGKKLPEFIKVVVDYIKKFKK